MASSTLLRTALRAVLGLALAAPFAATQAQTAPAAPSVAADTGQLETIVVTARRRSENLQNVPLAVTAVSADQILAQDITNLEDLNSLVPNMKISAGRATSSTINVYIRGVGQSDPLWGFEPGVGIYIDDVYMARPQGALLDVLDVDRLEVLRGPQGTLYGKNTIAGAIKYVTRDITGPAAGNFSLATGSYGELDAKASYSMPLADHVYFGIALADLQHSGYGEVVAQAGTTPSPYNHVGEGVSDKDILAARANLTFTWGESSKLKFVADTTQDNSHAAGGQRLNDGYALGKGLVSATGIPVAVPALDSRYDTRTDMPVDKDFFYRSGISGTYTQGLGGGFDLKVVGAYREGHGRQFIDFEELNSNLFQVPARYRERQSSAETQLTFTNDLVKAVGGVFYMDGLACGDYNASLGIVAFAGLQLTSLVDGCVDTKSTSVYADTAWKVTERFNIDAGLRWNQDKKSAQVYQAQWGSPAASPLPANQGIFDLQDPTQPPPGYFFYPSAAAGILSNYTAARTFSNVSPRLGVDFHLTDKVMAYLSYSKGFKSGGFDMRGNALLYPQTKNGYDSEIANSYEAGFKSTLLDNTLLLNVTLFYDPYTDAQIGVQQFVGTSNVTAVLNAGKQMNRGVEIETQWKPVRAATLGLNVGYLDSYYEDFIVGCTALTPGCSPNSTINVADQNRPINAPAWTIDASVAYSWMLSGGDITARANYDFRSFTKVANTTASVTDQPAYGIVDVGLAYTTSDKGWRWSLDVKNLTDKWYRVAGYDFGTTGLTAGVSQIGFYGAPRTVSVGVSHHF
ncbi:MAG TPA: TonB-dependent receptor [Steroidobacteraceae bacterium]|nr:TonB-dependent receptor [Steroidobacteraceae bacterium]